MNKKVICEYCRKEIEGEHFESYSGEHICLECGDSFYIDDYTANDEYPYIDGEGTWDGGMWEGESFKLVDLEEKKNENI